MSTSGIDRPRAFAESEDVAQNSGTVVSVRRAFVIALEHLKMQSPKSFRQP